MQESGLILAAWQEELPDCPNRSFLLQGIADGFNIVDIGKISTPVETDNYHSATGAAADKVEKQIITELENGRYKIVDQKPIIVSALGAIPKKDSNKVRLIHDASRPDGLALNDFTTKDKFSYQSLQDAVDLIKPGMFMAKADLANAYRSVKIHPSNYMATGLKWRFSGHQHASYMVDTRLPYGSSKSPELFNQLTQAVRRMMAIRGYDVIAYLDDFLILAESYERCRKGLNTLLSLLRKLGFDINYSKLAGPAQRLVFLGILLDTIKMTLEIPPQKINELYKELLEFRALKKLTKLDIQRLVGRLNWVTQCIYGGRFHMRRLIDVSSRLRHPKHRVRMTRDMRDDIDFWLEFIPTFNGCMPMVESRPATPVSTDACLIAAGACYHGDWIYAPWTPETRDKDCINYKEVMALEPAALRWSEKWRNKKVFVHIDNMAAVAIINRGSCKQPMVMACLRRIFWLSAVFNFRLRAVYYPGIRNVLADAASRLHEPGGGPRLLSLLASMPHHYQQCVNSPPLITLWFQETGDAYSRLLYRGRRFLSVNKRLPLIQKRVTAPTETPI